MGSRCKSETQIPCTMSPSSMTKEYVAIQISKFIIILYAMFSIFFIAHEVGNYNDIALHVFLPIGITLFSVPIGCWISRIIDGNSFFMLVASQLLMSIVGAISFPALGLLYALVGTGYYALVIFTTVAIGILLGTIISLSNKILDFLRNSCSSGNFVVAPVTSKNSSEYPCFGRNLLTTRNWKFGVFSQIFCTLGCFTIASVLALLLALQQTSIGISVIFLMDFPILVTGIVNFLIFKDRILTNKKSMVKILFCLSMLLLTGSLAFSQKILHCLEHKIYHDRVIFSSYTSSGQNVVLTKYNKDVRMFIDGHIQFSSIDEYRYHELLVHIPMSLAKSRSNALILGGGNGLAAKELLKYAEINTITIVDIDHEITDLFRKDKLLKSINNNSMNNPKVTIVNEDAFDFIKNVQEFYDIVIIDLPDPNDVLFTRLYSKEFYKMLAQKLSANATVVTQAMSLFFSCEAFWRINGTFRNAGYNFTKMYHGYIPSFGDCGFVVASINRILDVSKIHISVQTKYLNDEVAQKSFLLEKDIIGNNLVP